MNAPAQVEAVLSADEKDHLIHNMVVANPMWQGAQVADILDHMNNTDMFVDVTDYLLDNHTTGRPPELVATVIRALIAINGSRDITWLDVQLLLDRIQ